MDAIWWLTVACVALLVAFDYTNGFHDTANMVAAVVASRAMTPPQAIGLISLFTFLGPLLRKRSGHAGPSARSRTSTAGPWSRCSTARPTWP